MEGNFPTSMYNRKSSIVVKKTVPWIFFEIVQYLYRIVASTNTCYYSENQLLVKRSQYIRTENPLHKQSEKAKTCH